MFSQIKFNIYRRRIAMICDEVFALSIFKETETYHSILTLLESIDDPNNIAWIWGFGKVDDNYLADNIVQVFIGFMSAWSQICIRIYTK